MGERRGTRGLELWCGRMTEGYPGVKVENMTTSWRDGLAFCAIIHHFRPDLIDFSKLDKKDIYHNNNLAFRIAEDHLGIPALLEPEDMVEYTVPDRLSILTYLSQFYQVFAVNSNSPSKVLSKRPPSSDLHMVTATGSTPPKKAAYGALGARIREPCAKCGLPVFIAERLNVGKTLYHRTCFRCAKCDTQLTPGSGYDFENGEPTCVSCPEKSKENVIRNRSLSDEEKSASLKRKFDPYSASFEQALEYSKDASLKRSFTLDRVLGGAFQKARSEFMTTQMTSFDTDLDKEPEEKPPDLPVSLRPGLLLEDYAHSESNDEIDIDNSLPCFSDNSSVNSDEQVPNEQCESQEPVTKDSTHAVSMKPSIRPRMKISEVGIHNNSKVTEKSHVESEELIPCNPTGKLCENEEKPSNEIVRPEDVSEIISVHDSMSEKKEDSLVESYIVSDFSECNNSKEIITISSDNLSDQFPTPLKENSVITISSEDCSPYVSEKNEDSVKSPPIVKYPVDLNPFSDDEEVDVESHPAGIAEPVVVTTKSVSLNPFGDTDEEDEGEEQETANKSLNPFGSDDDDDEEDQSPNAPESLGNDDANANQDHAVTFPQPRLRRLLTPRSSQVPSGPENLSSYQPTPTNSNDGTYQGSRSASPQPLLRKLKAPKISLTPLGSEEPGNSTATRSNDDRYRDDQSAYPQPMLRKLKAPKISLTPLGSEEPSSGHSTATSSPAQSLYGSGRKKRQAPRPPIPQEFNDSPYSSLNSSPSHKEGQLPKSRKTKRAPLPPASTPTKQSLSSQFPTISPIEKTRDPSQIKMEMEEITKDEANSLKLDPIKKLTLKEIEQDLEIVEVQMRGLEKNGVILEKLIREKSEIPGANPDDALSPEVEDMILELFELVNEKCELFRKQTELNYLRRQNCLEREQADIENQLRELMLHPDAHKTDSDKAKEEELLNKMLEIVERRNEIVDRLENDRRREAEEDKSIRNHMSLYSMRRENEHSSSKKPTKKDKQKHEKDKKSKKNKSDSLKSNDDSKQMPKEKKKKKMLNLF